MRRLIRISVVLLVLGGLGAGVYALRQRGRQPPNYRHAEVSRGAIVSVVNSTGTVQPVRSVSVGAFVSGPIKGVYVDYNAAVDKNQLLAEIDPRLYKAAVDQGLALLATRNAEVERAKAVLQQAQNDEARAQSLQKENKNFISATEMDQFKFNRLSLAAQMLVAEAAVKQAAASLETAQANLAYTEIRSPEKGIVINRKIDPGQTLASQFQTPELFVVAPDISKMHILASVDEADIGQIREAQRLKLPVSFTVDAYPDDLFPGKIAQVRMNSTTVQNVVTYPVVVEAPNLDLKLMPGMTASLSFQVDDAKEVLRIPNAALRFFPKRELVRPEDRKLLEGGQQESADDNDASRGKLTAAEKAQARKDRNRRHVWVQDGEFLKALEVVTGTKDNKHTQLVSGELTEGQQLVTGIRAAE